jgi:adenylate cyclase
MLARSHLIKAAVLGLFIAAAGLGAGLTPLGLGLEQDIGLNWLFQLRGPRAAPPEVIIVSIDRASSDRLGLSNKPRQWPRSLHAELIGKLAQRGAAVIAFDIIFEQSRDPAHDQALAQAIREAGNVVLFEYLEKESLALDVQQADRVATVNIEKLVPPMPILADAAIALAPFPLPKVPAKVSQVYLFKTGAGDIPTLPVTALQVFALPSHDALLGLLQDLGAASVGTLPSSARTAREQGRLGALLSELRVLFLSDPSLADTAVAKLRESQAAGDRRERELLQSLVTMYAGRADMFVNYYGPPRSITTIPYYRILEADPDAQLPVDITGAAVFVGFSEQLQPEQKDGFYTVYSQASGLDVSGVEIAATTFANLLERRPVIQPTWGSQIMILGLWGLGIGFVLRLLPGVGIIALAMAAGIMYLGTAYLAFERSAAWLPLVTPLLWQTPLAVVAALLWRYLDVRREKQNIRRAFDYHLPPQVVDELASGTNDLTVDGRLMHGICLATDAEQYTQLSEQLAPGALRELMNRYYAVIFEPVRQGGGIVSDVVGDAMLAIWAAKAPEPQFRERACQAALAIVAAVDAFNRGPDKARLPTRVGIHCGEVVIGHVGALNHFEYRAVGDIVNTATRIEGLNKRLGTRILASASVLRGLDGFVSRPLGRFLLAGKSKSLELHELVGLGSATDAEQTAFLAQFAATLRAFHARRWSEAAEGFQACLTEQPQDGPSQYYLHLCHVYDTNPPNPDWDGTLRMDIK